jgi:hypothetical protein
MESRQGRDIRALPASSGPTFFQECPSWWRLLKHAAAAELSKLNPEANHLGALRTLSHLTSAVRMSVSSSFRALKGRTFRATHLDHRRKQSLLEVDVALDAVAKRLANRRFRQTILPVPIGKILTEDA